MLHVQTNHLRAEIVVGTGADRLAGERVAEEGEEAGRRDHRRHRGEEPRLVDQDRTQLEGFQLIVDLHIARVGAEGHQHRVHENDGDGDEQHELRMLGSGDEGIDQARLQRVAEDEERGGDRQHGDEGIELERGEERGRRVHGDGHHLAVREVHHAHHAEDHREAERHQAIHQPRQDPGDDDVGD